MGLRSDGYASFTAEAREFNDGEETCAATITVSPLSGVGSSETYSGSTKDGLGHAEMSALIKFLRQIKFSQELFANYRVVVECTSKPCCLYCSAILGSLGIVPTQTTFKSPKTMGISYAVHHDLRKFLRMKLRTTEQNILEQFCG
jgi:hypothetical protein